MDIAQFREDEEKTSIVDTSVEHAPEELARFYHLLQVKSAENPDIASTQENPWWGITKRGVGAWYGQTLLWKFAGFPVDTLIDPAIHAPQLFSCEEYNQRYGDTAYQNDMQKGKAK